MGVIIPPSILMVVWGGLMTVSIGGLFLAGVVPGMLIALSMMGTVYVYAKIYGYPRLRAQHACARWPSPCCRPSRR